MVVCGAAYDALTYLYLHNDSRLCTLLVGRFDIFMVARAGRGCDDRCKGLPVIKSSQYFSHIVKFSINVSLPSPCPARAELIPHIT